jgi:hypothetical protein
MIKIKNVLSLKIRERTFFLARIDQEPIRKYLHIDFGLILLDSGVEHRLISRIPYKIMF